MQLTYNSVTGNIYCLKNDTLAKINIGDSSFSATVVVPPAHSSGYNGNAGITADNASGYIYYDTYDSLNCYIEQYRPGDAIATVVASYPISTGWLFGLRSNNNDHMLYCLKTLSGANVPFFEPVPGSNLIRINPTSGTMTTVGHVGYVNTFYFSATIDQCNNWYAISSVGSASLYVPDLLELDMSGDTVQNVHTGTFYQGLVFY